MENRNKQSLGQVQAHQSNSREKYIANKNWAMTSDSREDSNLELFNFKLVVKCPQYWA